MLSGDLFTSLANLYLDIDKSQFLSNLFSSLIIVFFTSLLLPAYLTWQKRPKKLEFFFYETGNNKLPLIETRPGYFQYSFELVIRHPGGESFKEGVFWHLYVPNFISIQVDNLGYPTVPKRREYTERGVTKLYGFLDKEKIFSETTTEFRYRFFGEFSFPPETPNKKIIPLLYSFSTEFGDYPRGLKKLSKQEGIVDIRTASRLYLYSLQETGFFSIPNLITKTKEIIRSKFTFIFKLILFFLLPLAITFWLFKPFYKIELPQYTQSIIVLPKNSFSRFTRSIIAETMQTSLNMGLYNLCVENNGFVSINEQIIDKKIIKDYGQPVGVAQVDIQSINGTTTLLVEPKDTKCAVIKGDNEQISINLGQVGGMILPDNNPEFLNKYFKSKPIIDSKNMGYEVGINFNNVKFYLKNNILSVNILKFLVVFLVWNSFVLLLWEIKKKVIKK